MKRYKTFIREQNLPEYVYRVLFKYDLDEEKYNDMVKDLILSIRTFLSL